VARSQFKKQIYRNLIIFSVVTLGVGWLGVALNRATQAPDPQQGLGSLVWIVIPMGTGLILRAFGGDGWSNLGLKPNLRSGWPWYVAAIAIFPLVSLLLFGLGPVVGAFSWAGFAEQGLGRFVLLVALSFASSFVKNIFEEFAWRGYLTSRFDALRLNPFINHLLTGLIWAGWHVPYWLFIVDVRQFTSLDTPAFIVVGIFTLVVTAITYGELRLLSQTVWTAVILHSVANAITATFLLDGFVELEGALGAVFSPGNDGVVHSVLFALIGVGLYRYRMRNVPRGDTR
jgi:membrane protease YdiL (CAAX protease family)